MQALRDALHLGHYVRFHGAGGVGAAVVERQPPDGRLHLTYDLQSFLLCFAAKIAARIWLKISKMENHDA